MKLRSKWRIALLAGAAVAVIGLSIGGYVYFKPHRNVQNQSVDEVLTVQQLTAEFSNNAAAANARFLAADGNSKILLVSGPVASISTNQQGETVVLLKEPSAGAGVMATLLSNETAGGKALQIGDTITIKGAITAGNSYDADLDLYEHAILVQAAVVSAIH